MGLRTFLQKIFKIDSSSQRAYEGTALRMLNGSPTEYNSYSGEFYANSLVRSIVHKIASYGSMISFEHVRGFGQDFSKLPNSPLNKLLNLRPNSLPMTPAEMQYKLWTDLLIRNNSYMWLQRNNLGEITAMLPVVASSVELKEIDGFLFYKFYFESGETLVVSASDIIHNKRYFYKNDIFGSSNDPLRESLGLVETMNVSWDAALKNGAQIKGILKHQNTIDPEDLAKHEKLFRESYLRASNSGGIGMLDAKFDFIPINYTGKIIDSEAMKEIRDYVYRYFGVNDEILMSKYTSDTWQAYHESVIAPILNSMEQNFNSHCFTEKQLGFGNRIVSSVNMISFMNAAQRISMVKLALDGALYTRNEIRQWFGDAPIPGGDTFQYSKNFTENTSQNTDTKAPKEEAPKEEEEQDVEASTSDIADAISE